MTKKVAGVGVSALVACTLSTQIMAANILKNGDFEGNKLSPWIVGSWEDSIAVGKVSDGRICIDITNSGSAEWETQLRQNSMNFVNGNTYSFSADVWSSKPVTVKLDAADEVPGVGGAATTYPHHFGDEFSVNAPLNGSPQTITGVFVNERDTVTGKVNILLGDDLVPANTMVCFDNIVLDDPKAVVETGPGDIPVSPVRVNQHAYLPDFSKEAVYVTSAASPVSWELKKGGSVVESGSTKVVGLDAASGDKVHTVDFSSVTTEGDNYTLEVDGNVSFPFAIDGDAYKDMKYDALAYFYHNRSSTPILADVVGDEYARAAGHPDTAVETAGCTDAAAGDCLTVDVSGGWYDAGDHGKYVVNGGISAWTLLNQYERSMNLGSNASDFADGSMALPSSEANNGVSDLLDEARWQVEWFLKMQAASGLVYHKVHTKGWTAIPLKPSDDGGERIVQPESTAATLNFAAVTAQCYRTFKSVDSTFANTCLSAAKKAYSAAKVSPNIHAILAKDSMGSGEYGDTDFTDEFYWAATELYVSTGMATYLTDMKGAKYYKEHFSGAKPLKVADETMAWPTTQALGLISLASAKGTFVRDAGMQSKAQNYLIGRADYYVSESSKQGYGLPYKGENAAWGSNSNVVNNMMIIALANDFTCGSDDKYMNAMQKGMSYLMGTNPMDQSYVTKYGERATEQPHHRFWAKAASALFPAPPAGVLSGGPNAGLEDPIAEVDLAGCDPLKCYMDNIDSWSTNEITINWNAPFAWTTAYMDEQGSAAGQSATEQRCKDGAGSSSSSKPVSSSSAPSKPVSSSSAPSKPASSSSSSASSDDEDSGGAIGFIELLAMLSLTSFGLFSRRRKA